MSSSWEISQLQESQVDTGLGIGVGTLISRLAANMFLTSGRETNFIRSAKCGASEDEDVDGGKTIFIPEAVLWNLITPRPSVTEAASTFKTVVSSKAQANGLPGSTAGNL